ncbi:prolipoprotein diacylglyceryl transferase [Mesonia ostreae]|uniref:Phosphatidylglycerol--prolipoprotein diacylglyceryl transferase n=1 Tax=Mesonia ostreae TaxID=861110 RepID=A0ABU2KL81_9FLAO|nr:prolipoprotein diacylglyceryl transferase [Mesonia ostreae]MDT0295461.1 prolipoprotein diacylglyceryl transferase [Mesonia ostreae]
MLANAIVWDPSTGIDLGFFMIRYYSLSYLVAFTLGWYLMKNILERERMGEKELDAIFMYTVIAVLLGARLGHVIFYQPELFLEDPLSIILPARFVPTFEFTGFQGLASHGAAIGVIIAMYFYSKNVVKKPMLWILDRIVIPVASGGVFIRIGNFINSEIIGKPTGTDYGVIFKQLGESFPRHPAQLYEAACYVIVFIIVWYLYWKTNKREKLGYIFGVFLVLLWSVRFFIEFIKEAQVEDRAAWALNTGQWLSIPFILIGLYLIFRKNTNTPVTT